MKIRNFFNSFKTMERDPDTGGIVIEDPRKITLRQLCEALNVNLPAKFNDIADEPQKMSFRSRQVKKGNVCLIIRSAEDLGAMSLTSKKQYDLAIENGAKVVVMGRKAFKSTGYREADCPVILMDNPYESVSRLFKICRGQLSGKVVMLTGSVGKTTTKNFCYEVTKNRRDTFANVANTNTVHRVAGHLFHKCNDGREVYIQEAGAGYVGSVRFAASMLKPDIFILTNVYEHHLQMYGNMKNLMADKTSADDFLSDDGIIITNFDEDNIRNHPFKHKVVSFGIKSDDVDYRAVNIKSFRDDLSFDIVEKSTGETTHIKIKIIGEHNIYNALAAFAMARALGISAEEIREDFLMYRSAGIRQNLTNVAGTYINVDCYNVSEESILTMIEAGETFELPEGGKRYAAIGGENKLGKDNYSRNVAFGKKLAKVKVDEILFCGNEDRSLDGLNRYGDALTIQENFVKNCDTPNEICYNTDGILDFLKRKVKPGDLVMFKGIFMLYMNIAVDKFFGTSFSWDLSHHKEEMVKVFDKGLNARYVPNFGEAQIIKTEKTGERLTIPETIGGYPVFRVASQAFTGRNDIKQVVFENGLKNIGKEAFAACEGITEVEIPSSILLIETKAFADCKNLETVKIEEGLTHISTMAFKGCDSLQKVYLPDSVRLIEDEAFANTDVTIVCSEGSYAEEYAKANGLKIDK